MSTTKLQLTKINQNFQPTFAFYLTFKKNRKNNISKQAIRIGFNKGGKKQYLWLSLCVKWLQSYPTLCDPMYCSLPGSSVQDAPGKNTGVGCTTQGLNSHFLFSCTGRWFFTTSTTMTKLEYQFPHSVVSNSLQPHGLQHPRPSCPSPTWVYSNSCPLSQWCHPTISSSVIPFSSAFNLSQQQALFKWVSSLHQVAKILEFQPQDKFFQWIFRTDFL